MTAVGRRWYPLALPDGTPLLAYDAEARYEGDALALAVTLEAASAELLDESGLFGHLHLPDEPRLELRLDLVMARPEGALAAARGAEGGALLAAL
ncbi:MAG: hypothetical protein KC635_24430, partial [Myxococcales bacterium]|nr:hypothetical protein [Myxococcales bacterium]